MVVGEMLSMETKGERNDCKIKYSISWKFDRCTIKLTANWWLLQAYPFYRYEPTKEKLDVEIIDIYGKRQNILFWLIITDWKVFMNQMR
jgi:hypothetical protein